MATMKAHGQTGALSRCRGSVALHNSASLPSGHLTRRCVWHGVSAFSKKERSAGLTIRASATSVEEVEEMPKKREKVMDYNKTYYPRKMDTDGAEKPWFIVNADGQILGRMASLIAVMIRGKLNPAYTPSMDMGAFVVVINAEKVTVSGNKYRDKIYYRHTVGRPGSLKRESFKTLQNRIPERIIEKAVKGMLPKGRLGRRLFHHLKIYKGDSHPHAAQKPRDITVMIDAKPSVYAPILAETFGDGV